MRTVRPLALADHLWELYGRMAEEMGSDREALVNQALHVFARLNGYLLPAEGRVERPPPDAGERRAVAEQVLETAARLEREVRSRDTPPPIPAAPPAPGQRGLVLVREDGSRREVQGERLVIGRGRHCDLVLDEPKVSREHAAVVRDGDGWAIEDLGSANGTWRRGQRVERCRIEDGDEVLVCSERIRFQLR